MVVTLPKFTPLDYPHMCALVCATATYRLLPGVLQVKVPYILYVSSCCGGTMYVLFPTYFTPFFSFDNDIDPRSSYGLKGSLYFQFPTFSI